MILGTHNSLTGYKPKHWYGWLMKPFAKCQSKTIHDQYEEGVRCFDIRVRFDKNGKWVFAHGIYELDINPYTDIFYELEEIARLEESLHPEKDNYIYCRVIMESHRGGSSDKDKVRFAKFCELFKEFCPTVTFFGGNEKNGSWFPPVYDFGNDYPIIQAVGSMANQEPRAVGARWWELFMPKAYARRNNKANTYLLSDEDGIVLFDYVRQWT